MTGGPSPSSATCKSMPFAAIVRCSILAGCKRRGTAMRRGLQPARRPNLVHMTMRTEPMRVALAQMNAVVGDIEGNAGRIRGLIDEARDEGAQLVVFPELALTGYPPEDLLLKTHFADAAGEALEELAAGTRDIVALVGFPERAD